MQFKLGSYSGLMLHHYFIRLKDQSGEHLVAIPPCGSKKMLAEKCFGSGRFCYEAVTGHGGSIMPEDGLVFTVYL